MTRERKDSSAAPVALFVYNRPWHTRRTVEALQYNELAPDTELIVFSDGAKDAASVEGVREVRHFIQTIAGFRTVRIVEREANMGLARSIIDGVTTVCRDAGRVVVMEDDLVTSPYFLRYMNEALNFYEDDERVGSVHGYWYPADRIVPETFFLRGASCWGWATWARAWRLFEPNGSALLRALEERRVTGAFDLEGAAPYTTMLRDQIAGRNDSWAVRWHASMFLADRLQLWPGRSLVRNIGFDGTGAHCGESTANDVEPTLRPIVLCDVPVEECGEARAALIHFHRSMRPGLIRRAIGRFKRIFPRSLRTTPVRR